ncbi:MAG: hypothetical protein AAB573_04785 [Patescibacteria group bacterium]
MNTGIEARKPRVAVSKKLGDFYSKTDILNAINVASNGHVHAASHGKSMQKVFEQLEVTSPLIERVPFGAKTHIRYHKSLIPSIARAYFRARNSSSKPGFHLLEVYVNRALAQLDQKFGS